LVLLDRDYNIYRLPAGRMKKVICRKRVPENFEEAKYSDFKAKDFLGTIS
jgi:hypothetical protein